jgi:phosphatidylglycerophosphatase C
MPSDPALPAQSRTIAVFDLDGTITTRDTGSAYFLSFLRQHPRRWLRGLPLVGTAARFGCGLVDNAGMKQAALSRVLGGVDRAAIEAWTARFVPWCLDRLVRPGARSRIAAHRESGDRLVLATASLDLYVDPLARALGFAEILRTKAAWTADGRISGALDGENVRGEHKLAAVRRHLGFAETGPRAAFVIAYSDHHADLPLLRWADKAVAVHPTARLAKTARAEGFAIADWGRP